LGAGRAAGQPDRRPDVFTVDRAAGPDGRADAGCAGGLVSGGALGRWLLAGAGVSGGLAAVVAAAGLAGRRTGGVAGLPAGVPPSGAVAALVGAAAVAALVLAGRATAGRGRFRSGGFRRGAGSGAGDTHPPSTGVVRPGAGLARRQSRRACAASVAAQAAAAGDA